MQQLDSFTDACQMHSVDVMEHQLFDLNAVLANARIGDCHWQFHLSPGTTLNDDSLRAHIAQHKNKKKISSIIGLSMNRCLGSSQIVHLKRALDAPVTKIKMMCDILCVAWCMMNK